MIKKYLVDGSNAIFSLKEKVFDTFGGRENYPHHYILKLFYSKMYDLWTPQAKGKLAASLENDGDGVTLFFKSGKTISLDYAEFFELQVLIREHNLMRSPFKRFNVKEFKTKKELK